MAEREGGPFSESDRQLVRVLAVEAALAVGNARRDEEARQRERWIDGSVAVTTALLSANDAEDALVVVAEKARRLANSTAGIVLLPTEAGGLEILAVDADEPVGLLGTVVSPEAPIVPHLMGGEPIFVEDSATDSRMTTSISERFGPSMMLPLRSGSRVLGILTTPRKRGARPFTETERTLATQFAAQAALALVLAEARRDRERLAVFEDRDRIARDLHDLVIQRLFATGMMLEGAQRKAIVPAVQDQDRQGRGRAGRHHPGGAHRDLRPPAGPDRGSGRAADPGAAGDRDGGRAAGLPAVGRVRGRCGRPGLRADREEPDRGVAGGAVQRGSGMPVPHVSRWSWTRRCGCPTGATEYA